MLSNPQKRLTPLQWKVLKEFFSAPVSAPFFLTGGTALSGFYFGHRTSIDLDFFSLESLDKSRLKSHLEKISKQVKGVYRIKTDSDTLLTGFVEIGKSSLKVDVVQDIPVHFGEFQVDESIRVDSLENIGSNKITAIYGRSDAKDFIDLYWILERDGKQKFEQLLKDAKKKDVGIADFHLGQIFLNPPEDKLFQQTTPAITPQAIKKFFFELGTELLKTAKRPEFG